MVNSHSHHCSGSNSTLKVGPIARHDVQRCLHWIGKEQLVEVPTVSWTEISSPFGPERVLLIKI